MIPLTQRWLQRINGRFAIGFLCIALLTACASLPQSSLPQSSSTDDSVQSADAKTGLIEYHRSGGFAGFDDQLTVASDGKVTLIRRGKSKTTEIDLAIVQQLQQALEAANFASLNSEYLPAQQGADYMEHTIFYQSHAVHAVDTATPDALLPVLTILTDVIKQVQ